MKRILIHFADTGEKPTVRRSLFVFTAFANVIKVLIFKRIHTGSQISMVMESSLCCELPNCLHSSPIDRVYIDSVRKILNADWLTSL